MADNFVGFVRNFTRLDVLQVIAAHDVPFVNSNKDLVTIVSRTGPLSFQFDMEPGQAIDFANLLLDAAKSARGQ